MSSPRVSDNPVLGSVFNTKTNDRDIVDDVHVASGILINTSSVGLKRIGNSNTASNGATLIDLLHHVLLARDGSELVNIEDSVLIWDEAWATTWLAILANVDRCALDTIVMATSLIDGTGLISDVVLVHVIEGRDSLTTMASIVIH